MKSANLPYRPCVGIMVLNREGRVWIGRRFGAPSEPEGPGAWWQMPQGGIDEHEDIEEAARRELSEETGIRSVELVAESPGWYVYDLPEHLRPAAWGGRYRGQKQKWLVMRFAGDDAEVVLDQPGHAPEFDAWRWAGIDELVGLVVAFKRPVYEQLVRDLGHLARPQK